MKDLLISLRLLIVLTVLTGAAYPMVVTLIAQTGFKDKANGSLITQNGIVVVGSSLIGQPFDAPNYFWSRPSATSPNPYNAASSGGSNLGPTNPDLKSGIEGRVKALKDADPTNTKPVPTDLVTASASGLDPDISVEAAEYQVARVAQARHMNPSEIQDIIQATIQHKTLGILGEERVNVLALNRALDAKKAQ